jgi:hypothetical protein
MIKLYDAIHSIVFDLEVNGDALYNNILYTKYQHWILQCAIIVHAYHKTLCGFVVRFGFIWIKDLLQEKLTVLDYVHWFINMDKKYFHLL